VTGPERSRTAWTSGECRTRAGRHRSARAATAPGARSSRVVHRGGDPVGVDDRDAHRWVQRAGVAVGDKPFAHHQELVDAALHGEHHGSAEQGSNGTAHPAHVRCPLLQRAGEGPVRRQVLCAAEKVVTDPRAVRREGLPSPGLPPALCRCSWKRPAARRTEASPSREFLALRGGPPPRPPGRPPRRPTLAAHSDPPPPPSGTPRGETSSPVVRESKHRHQVYRGPKAARLGRGGGQHCVTHPGHHRCPAPPRHAGPGRWPPHSPSSVPIFSGSGDVGVSHSSARRDHSPFAL
jgi:hypothetical protein